MWTAEIHILNEDTIVAVVIAIEAIANKPEKIFGTSTVFEPMASALALQSSNKPVELWWPMDWEEANLLSSS